MAKSAVNIPLRTLVVLLAILAGVLSCAIYVAASAPGRSRTEALAEAKLQADEEASNSARAAKDAADRIDALNQEIAELKKQLEAAKANIAQGAQKLAAAQQEALRLRSEYDAVLKQVDELRQKDADARIKKAEDARIAAQKRAAIVKVPEKEVVQADNTRRAVANDPPPAKRRVAVASLPRTTPSFSELDKHQDGRLTFEEYKAGYPNATEAEFKALDTNGDGFLSIDEYKAGHPDPGVVPIAKKKGKKGG
jgi:peptidoglycan hydrolase CwlO-like protein